MGKTYTSTELLHQIDEIRTESDCLYHMQFGGGEAQKVLNELVDIDELRQARRTLMLLRERIEDNCSSA